jgi:2-polyprenyl-6-methoxyphenol hydroxylase-like FAD-dependent oxidoreductase
MTQDADMCPTDIIVIGAGLAGTSAALVLGEAGYRVALIDTHARHPPEFRAEKLGPDQMALFERLALGDIVRPLLTPMDDLWVYRFGRLVERGRHREYGFTYEALINGLRAALPMRVRFLVGKVASVATAAAWQSVALADGTRIEARLVVIATGLGDAVRRAAGIRRVEVSRGHSLSLAVTLARPASAYPFESLTYYGTGPGTRLAYLTLFPVGARMRANVFTYRAAGEAWTRSFRAAPAEGLAGLAPEIAGICGDFATTGPVELRSVDLLGVDGHVRDGVVLIGDAFLTTCPAPGVGIQRVMTDVERLCRIHLPRWLETPGMAAAKIATFYDDPIKRATDAQGVAASWRARSMATETSLPWAARRLAAGLARRVRYAGRGIAAPSPGPAMGAMR